MKNEKMKIDSASAAVDGRLKSKAEKEPKYCIVAPKEFIARRDQLPLSLLAFLTKYKSSDYKKMRTRLYLSEDNRCGFGLNPDGGLISVFSLEKERGPALVKEALARGAKFLSCVGEKLRELYGDAGFRVMKEEPWNENCAPEYWDYDRFGTPNYYEMELSQK